MYIWIVQEWLFVLSVSKLCKCLHTLCLEHLFFFFFSITVKFSLNEKINILSFMCDKLQVHWNEIYLTLNPICIIYFLSNLSITINIFFLEFFLFFSDGSESMYLASRIIFLHYFLAKTFEVNVLPFEWDPKKEGYFFIFKFSLLLILLSKCYGKNLIMWVLMTINLLLGD